MKIAILLKSTRLDELENSAHIILVKIIDDRIEEVKNEYMSNENLSYFTLWLLIQQVNIVYVQDSDNETRSYFKKLDIEIRTYDDIQNHHILKKFLL